MNPASPTYRAQNEKALHRHLQRCSITQMVALLRMPPREPPKDPNATATLSGAAPVSRGTSPANTNNKQHALRRPSGTGQGNDGAILDAIAAKVAAKLAQPAVAPTLVLQPLTPEQQALKATIPAAVGVCWWEAVGFNPGRLLQKLVPPPPPEVDAKGKEKQKAAKKGKGKEMEVPEDMQVGGLGHCWCH